MFFRLSVFTDIRASPEWKQIGFTPIFASIFLNSNRNIITIKFRVYTYVLRRWSSGVDYFVIANDIDD